MRKSRFTDSQITGTPCLVVTEAIAVVATELTTDQPNKCNNRPKDRRAILDCKARMHWLAKPMFRFADGRKPFEMNKVFNRLLTEMDMVKGQADRDRTLYGLWHTYATNELLTGTDIHTLALQMGTSVWMLERNYCKVTATMAAAELA